MVSWIEGVPTEGSAEVLAVPPDLSSASVFPVCDQTHTSTDIRGLCSMVAKSCAD